MFRRDFLKTGSVLGMGAFVPGFIARTAHAAPELGSKGAKDTILVVVQLTGGNDGLNTVIPIKNEKYYQLRPTISIPADQTLKIDDSHGLHPRMNGFSGLLEKNALAVVQGVGYPNPSQSHFRSMDIWNAGSTSEKLVEGWVGNALKQMQCPAFHIAGDNESAPLALNGSPAKVPSITTVEDFILKYIDKKGQKPIIEATAKVKGKPGLLDFVQKTATSTYSSSQRLQEVAKNYQPKVTYPAYGLANRLKVCAQLIDAGMGARIFYVSMDGFDTHANQGGTAGNHANLLQEVSDSISAFYNDLAARGHEKRLMVMTFSEFGRRGMENGSKGTDHGSGAPMFVVGDAVKSGLIGKHPSLEKLDNGNLPHAIDFRQVYATILDKWLGVSSKDVLGAKYDHIGVL